MLFVATATKQPAPPSPGRALANSDCSILPLLRAFFAATPEMHAAVANALSVAAAAAVAAAGAREPAKKAYVTAHTTSPGCHLHVSS